MSHIHTKAGQHDHSVTAFILRIDGPEQRALVHIHKRQARLLPVGGHVELNETPWQAVAHEIAEESGYQLSELLVLQPNNRIQSLPGVKLHPYPIVLNTHDITPTHFHSDTAFGLIATGEPTGTMSADESLDLRWLTASEIAELDESEIFVNTQAVYKYVFDVCLPSWDRVTATSFDI